MALNSYLSIITLNVNELIAPIKRNRVKKKEKNKKTKIFPYAAYERFILDLKILAD